MRIIKYLFNFAGNYLMIWFAYISYALIVRFPDCDIVKEIILKNIIELGSIYFIYLVAITFLNLLFERRVEKRKKSKEYLLLCLINILILLLGMTFFSYDFYCNCRI